uniref:RNA helicase n=1 Tax=Paulinella chromatophora TaxID=39717 RepID=B1X5J6_PAUCH|nr:putative ATP-dependent RNA helicase [Paulinella chromatophora]ACB43215.1 putative ATP-dependent RNA helicase [Paulinella chromatophora]
MTKTTVRSPLTCSIEPEESSSVDSLSVPADEHIAMTSIEITDEADHNCTNNNKTDRNQDASGFADFGLNAEILQAVTEKGYKQPSPIQAAAIPELMLGRDLVGQAQTGTGKTAAFALPLLARMDPDQRSPQVLVLAPTRELAVQVADSFSTYAAHLPHIRVLPVYGGADFRDQINRLKRGIQVVVGTPGRVMDHMRQGTLDLSGLRVLVLDEADEMLRMGFIDDVEWIIEQLPKQRQVVLFSATMPTEIRRISLNYLNNPAEITIRQKGSDASRIRQRYLMVHAPHKLEALNRVLEAETGEGVIIFGRTKAITVTIAESLELTGHDVAVLNGDVAQSQRERTIERLRKGSINILVATDVAARGLDVDRVSLVINYDIPFDSEAYVHRIGRTGRAGRTGDAILFLTPRERRFLGGLERAVGRPIEPMDVPSNATINQNRLNRLHQSLVGMINTNKSPSEEEALLAELLFKIGNDLACTPSRLALAALQIAVSPNPLLVQGDEKWLRPAVGRDIDRTGGRERRDRNGNISTNSRGTSQRQNGRRENDFSTTDMHMDHFRIEVGWRDHVKPGNIVGAIANEAGIQGRMIGRIQIFDDYSTIDLPKGMPEGVFQSLKYLKVMNKELQISRQNLSN